MNTYRNTNLFNLQVFYNLKFNQYVQSITEYIVCIRIISYEKYPKNVSTLYV